MQTQIKYLKTSELAAIFKRDKQTIRRWIHEGRLPALKIKSNYYVLEAEVEKFRNERG